MTILATSPWTIQQTEQNKRQTIRYKHNLQTTPILALRLCLAGPATDYGAFKPELSAPLSCQPAQELWCPNRKIAIATISLRVNILEGLTREYRHAGGLRTHSDTQAILHLHNV